MKKFTLFTRLLPVLLLACALLALAALACAWPALDKSSLFTAAGSTTADTPQQTATVSGQSLPEGWTAMPAGARSTYLGIHGGTVPVSLLVSRDGMSLVSFVGQTGNDFLELLRRADVVTLHCLLTDETRKLIDRERLALMKPTALLINCARGPIVDEAALIEALENGRLAGAGLDVTDPEPLPETSPLWDAPNMLITPHVSGWFHLAATLNNVVDIAAENLRHLQAGETLRCWIEH